MNCWPKFIKNEICIDFIRLIMLKTNCQFQCLCIYILHKHLSNWAMRIAPLTLGSLNAMCKFVYVLQFVSQHLLEAMKMAHASSSKYTHCIVVNQSCLLNKNNESLFYCFCISCLILDSAILTLPSDIIKDMHVTYVIGKIMYSITAGIRMNLKVVSTCYFTWHIYIYTCNLILGLTS